MFWARIDLRFNLIAITNEYVFYDWDQIGIYLGVPRRMLFIQMHKIGRNDVHSMCAKTRAKTDHWYRKNLRQIFIHLLTGHLAHD